MSDSFQTEEQARAAAKSKSRAVAYNAARKEAGDMAADPIGTLHKRVQALEKLLAKIAACKIVIKGANVTGSMESGWAGNVGTATGTVACNDDGTATVTITFQ